MSLLWKMVPYWITLYEEAFKILYAKLDYQHSIQFHNNISIQDHWKKQYHKMNTNLPWEKPCKKSFLNIDDQKDKR